jgi:hypothetical protein
VAESFHRSIASYLQSVRKHLLQYQLRRTCWLAVSGLCLLGLTVPVASWALVGSRSVALSIISIGGVAAAFLIIAALVVGYILPRKQFETDESIARFVGRKHPGIGSDLLSTVQLNRSSTNQIGTVSVELVEALTRSTYSRAQSVAPSQLTNQVQLTKIRRIGLASIGVLAMLIIAGPQIRQGYHQLFFPQRTAFAGAALSATPLVGDLDIMIEYPAYTGRPAAALPSTSGDLRALPGTTVRLTAKALLPHKSAEILLEGATPEQSQTVALDSVDQQMSGQFSIKHAGRYRFALTSQHKRRTVETSPRTIELEVDRAPSVQLIAPADVLDVTSLRQVELAYVIEDDYGVTSAELTWQAGRESGKKILPLVRTSNPDDKTNDVTPSNANKTVSRLSGKILWDLIELPLVAGVEVRYWLVVRDNDNVTGPNIGKSKEFKLRIISPRERHEQVLAQQKQLVEDMLAALNLRLLMPGPKPYATTNVSVTMQDRSTLSASTMSIIEMITTVRTGFEKDPHASDALRKTLDKMRDRLEKLSASEQHILDGVPADTDRAQPVPAPGRFLAIDAKWVAELEEDILTLADWLDRERVEAMLDIADEAAAHQKKLKELMDEYAKTGNPKLKADIERELQALQQSLAQLEAQRAQVAQDVLDQFVHRDALATKQTQSCFDEVRSLFAAGKTAEAQAKLATCSNSLDEAAASLENSLNSLRGEKFGDEQRKLDEVLNELADTARDQDDIASEASRLFDEYAAKADDLARDNKREAAKKLEETVSKLRKQLKAIPDNGLTPFSKEELDIVERRIDDVERTIEDGDLAEASAMAKQADQSLRTIASELDSAMSDEPDSPFADATADALSQTEKARSTTKELMEALAKLAPSA